MSKPLQCPQCGANECTLIEDNRYHCNFCGSIFISGDSTRFQQEKIPVKQNYEGEILESIPKKAARLIGCSTIISMAVFAAVAMFIVRNTITKNAGSTSIFEKNYSESNSQFTVVNTESGTQIWTASMRDMNNSKEESYYLNQRHPKEEKPFNSILLGTVTSGISDEQAIYKVSNLQCIGAVCYAIVGADKLQGYDVNTQEQVISNEIISANFSEFKSGIAKVEDVYDLSGFKIITKDGFSYYFIPSEKITKNAAARTLGKLLTEKEYKNRFIKVTIDVEKNATEYCFTKGERQQLYAFTRETGMLFNQKISSSTLSDLLEDDASWYKKVYKINKIQEFTPGKIYFNATVLYSDATQVIVLFQNEAGDNVTSITLQCINTDKSIKWTKTGADIELLRKFIKSSNSIAIKSGTEIAVMQPYVAAVGIDSETGNINWTFKPY